MHTKLVNCDLDAVLVYFAKNLLKEKANSEKSKTFLEMERDKVTSFNSLVLSFLDGNK